MIIIKQIAKYIRIITVAPAMALVLISILYFSKGMYIGLKDFMLAISSLVIFSLLAYVVQDKFKIISGEKRKAERKLAIYFSIIGYIVGLSLAVILDLHTITKIMFLTYLLSGVLIGVFSFIIHINASGHMCGLAGPIAILVYVFGPFYLFLGLFLILVIWSSLKLERHNIKELIIGSFIPIISLVISIVLIK